MTFELDPFKKEGICSKHPSKNLSTDSKLLTIITIITSNVKHGVIKSYHKIHDNLGIFLGSMTYQATFAVLRSTATPDTFFMYMVNRMESLAL